MKKALLALMAAAAMLLSVTSVAGAATIEVLNLGAEVLNFETQGTIEFSATEPIAIRVICNKTMNGRLNRRFEGTLGLLTNDAGVISEIRLANCEGARVTALNNERNPVQLSALRVPATLNGGDVEIAGNRAEFQLVIGGIFTCLVRAELKSIARTTEARLYRNLTLELLSETSIVGRGTCPRRARMRGTLTVTKPSVGIGVILR